jgi:two-component sensor histidine kinase
MKLLFFIFYFYSFLYGGIHIEDGKQVIEDFKMHYILDEDKKLTIQDVEHKLFTNEVSSQFALGPSRGDIWFKIELRNETNVEAFILYFTESFFEYVNLYEKKDGKWHTRYSNLFQNEHKGFQTSPMFPVNIDENTSKIFYVKLHTKFQLFGEFKLYIDKELFYSDYTDMRVLYACFFGALLIIASYTLFLFFRLREKIYLYYSAYIFFYAIFVFYFSGFARTYGMVGTYYYIGSVPAVSIVFFVLFFTDLIGLPNSYPKLYKGAQVLMVLYMGVAILCTYDVSYFYLVGRFGVLIYTYVVVVIVYLLRKGQLHILTYMAILFIYLVSVVLLTLMLDGIIVNNDLTHYAFLYGSLLEIILFSFVLADRFHLIQQEKMMIQTEHLEYKTLEKERLEVEIEKRTQEVMSLLDEKKVLLKEVYHRVKNNFQMVISMLGLESFSIKDTKQSERFREIINRLKSMSSVHEFLYKSESLSQIKSKDYLLEIVGEIERMYPYKNLHIDMDIEGHMIDMDHAIMIGMISNEVITNAIKHHDKDTCNITLSYVQKDTQTRALVIQDDGLGFDTNSKDYQPGMGLSLIKEFTKKLPNAKIDFFTEGYTRFSLTYTL